MAEPVIKHIAVIVDAFDRQKAALHLATKLATNLRARLSGLLVPDRTLLQALDFPHTQYVNSALAPIVTLNRAMLEAYFEAIAGELSKILERRGAESALDFSLRVERNSAALPAGADLLIMQAKPTHITLARQMLAASAGSSSVGDRDLLLIRDDRSMRSIAVHVASLSPAMARLVVWAAQMAAGSHLPLRIVIDDPSLGADKLRSWLQDIKHERADERNLSTIASAIIDTDRAAHFGADVTAVEQADLLSEDGRLGKLFVRPSAGLLVLGLNPSS